MTKYKRWILVLSALTVLVVHVESLKATSLIHSGKFSKLLNATTTSTTSTTEETPNDRQRIITDGENSTKITLTGIPQIDYVWDPNLPRELNGFNLSTYPFLDSMPAEEDIGFDCEDKINGFYASTKFGCQLYHHCLYGVRSDFICANFTAFDQKTFICHFASEVDCKNSKKYWSRNDDLYKATTAAAGVGSSTFAPLIDRNIYKRPPPGQSHLNSGSQNSANKNQDQGQNSAQAKTNANVNSNNRHEANLNQNDDTVNTGGQRPSRPLRRPYRRRRPPVDYYYYDEEYEEEPYEERGRRRQRPRNRRPLYDDYDSRRQHDDRDRRPYDDDFDDYGYERRPYRNRNRSESRRNGDDHRRNEDRRFDDRRRPPNDDRKLVDERRKNDDRRPSEERRYSDEKRSIDDRKVTDERRSIDDRRFSDDRKANRNKNSDDEIARHTRKNPVESTEKKQFSEETSTNDEKLMTPVGSLFDKPRAPPKIARPVPLIDKSKYAFKPTEKPKTKEEEYYEEYEEEPLSSVSTTTTTAKSISTTAKGYYQRFKTSIPSTTTIGTTSLAATVIEYYDDEYDEVKVTSSVEPKVEQVSFPSRTKDERANVYNLQIRNQNENIVVKGATTLQPLTTDHFKTSRYSSERNPSQFQSRGIQTPNQEHNSGSTQIPSRKYFASNNQNDSKKFANKQTVFEPSTTVATTKATLEKISSNRDKIDQFYNKNTAIHERIDPAEDKNQKPVVRVVKRPFLPSRGGNPYKARGLQPVGALAALGQDEKAVNNADYIAPSSGQLPLRNPDYATNNYNDKAKTSYETSSNIHPRSESIKATSLDDLYNEEYDADLNDALNPMLKPLTSSRGVSGFSFSSLTVNNDDKDRVKAQSQLHKSVQKPDVATSATTAGPLYEYEEVEYEY